MPNLFLEIALIVASMLVSVGAVVVGVFVSREWSQGAVAFTLGAVVLLNGAASVVQVVKVRREYTRENEILARKAKLVKLLGEELDKASNIEYRLETLMTRNAMTQEALDGFVIEIESFRTRVGNELERVLPGTYAARVLLSARGAFPGLGIGIRPGFYQYTHVRECRLALTTILAAVDSFARLATEVSH